MAMAVGLASDEAASPPTPEPEIIVL
jgi:hypothetical protein